MAATIDQIDTLRSAGLKWPQIAAQLGENASTLRNRWHRARKRRAAEPVPMPTPEPADAGRVSVREADGVQTYDVAGAKTLAELAEACGVDLDAHEVVDFGHTTWPTAMKDADGQPLAVINWRTTAKFRPRPPWLARSPIEPGVALMPPPPVPKRLPDAERVVVVPDLQVGFRRRRDGTLDPMHDRGAIDLAIQAIAALQPSTVVWLGDNVDAAEMGSYRTAMEHFDTVDAALHELHFIYERARLACQSARHVVLEGNHDDRVERMLMDRARQVHRVRRVGSERGIASMPELLGLDALGIEYRGPYGTPGGDLWLWEGTPVETRFTHGEIVGNIGGATAAKLLRKHAYSVWQGHTHRAEVGMRTLWGPQGARIIRAASPGCLCRIDDAVPSARAHRDWQQGVGTIARFGERTFHAVHAIDDGALFLDGNLYTADPGRYTRDLRSRWPGFAWGDAERSKQNERCA